MRSVGIASFSLFLATILAGPVAAQERGKPKNDKAETANPSGLHVVLADREIRLIREYYDAKGQRPKPLPPGIAKNLARGKSLPPGIAKTRLPDDLAARLPARPGFEIVILGDRIALLDKLGIVVDLRIGL